MAGKIKVLTDPATGRYCIVLHGSLDVDFVLASPTVGPSFLDVLHAIGNGDGTVTVANKQTNSNEVANVAYSDFIGADELPLGSDEEDTVNELNAVFSFSGGTSGAPTITSATTIPAADDVPVNYLLEGDDIVGIEWGTLPSGLTVASNNRRNLVGLVSVAGSYNIDVTVANAFGIDSATLTLNVVSTYVNTRSVRFFESDYLSADAVQLTTTLGRAANGAGAGDAWSISLWIRPGTHSNKDQTILYYGGSDAEVQGAIRVVWKGTSPSRQNLQLLYGTGDDYLELTTPVGGITTGNWYHVLIAYDGGTTGNSSGSLASYLGRFEVWVDGVSQLLTTDHENFGWTGSIDADLFYIGKDGEEGSYLREEFKVEELAIWSTDQTANVAAIYNGGATHDLNLLGTAPDYWYRMGDGDTYPTIQDQLDPLANFTMLNMTATDIVSDVP